MALCTLADVLAIPGMRNSAANPPAWLDSLVTAMCRAVKKFTKQNIELRAWTEYHSGNEMPDLVLTQFPVLSGTTQLADSMSGLTLPQATIDVVSTTGFDEGGRSDGDPSITVQTGRGSFASVTYTGVTATSFTGCSGGTGTLSGAAQQNRVTQPSVWVDYNGYGGQGQQSAAGVGPFADTTILPQGNGYMVYLDNPINGQVSNRGLLRRVGGCNGSGWGLAGGWGGYGAGGIMGQGKLASGRVPCWTRGLSNIKVAYSAGYAEVPEDITYAVAMLVAYAARNMPTGAALSSESLGAYSYSVLQQSNDIPELGSVSVTLRPFREISW